MTKPDDQHDYLTGSVAGMLALFIILVGNALVAAWLFYFIYSGHSRAALNPPSLADGLAA